MAGKEKKNRKLGRNVNKCKQYFAEGRRRKNRKLRDLRIAKRYGQLSLLARKRKDLKRESILMGLASTFEKRAAA